MEKQLIEKHLNALLQKGENVMSGLEAILVTTSCQNRIVHKKFAPYFSIYCYTYIHKEVYCYLLLLLNIRPLYAGVLVVLDMTFDLLLAAKIANNIVSRAYLETQGDNFFHIVHTHHLGV